MISQIPILLAKVRTRMFGSFYNGTIRKLVVAFGSLFNSIEIERVESGGTKKILVPVSYSAKEKFLARIAVSLQEQQMETTLPRIGFEITGFVYDPARKRNSLSKTISRSNSTGQSYSYAEVPYNIDFGLYIHVRNMEDGLRIIEQILPYFSPEFVVTINFGGVNDKLDVPVYLNGILSQDEYEGELSTRRVITFTLNFTMKAYIFGEIKSHKEIRTVYANLNNFDVFSDDLSGLTADYATIITGITGPLGVTGSLGASSGITAYSATSSYIEYLNPPNGITTAPW